jgi:hypothetical protein
VDQGKKIQRPTFNLIPNVAGKKSGRTRKEVTLSTASIKPVPAQSSPAYGSLFCIK